MKYAYYLVIMGSEFDVVLTGSFRCTKQYTTQIFVKFSRNSFHLVGMRDFVHEL